MDSEETSRLPLSGQTVLVTRPAHQGDDLRALLEAEGAQVLHIPTIEIQPPASTEALDAALARIESYQWLLFTSANAVDFFFRRASELRVPKFDEAIGRIRVCAIGPATRAAAEAAGLTVHLVPEEYVAESIVDAFADEALQDCRILLPRAAAARDVAPDALRAQGATVDAVDSYRSGIPLASRAAIAALLEQQTRLDWVTFTSSSTVKNFLAMGGRPLLKAARIASIGPITTDTATKHGLHVGAEAAHHTAGGLVEAILQSMTLGRSSAS